MTLMDEWPTCPICRSKNTTKVTKQNGQTFLICNRCRYVEPSDEVIMDKTIIIVAIIGLILGALLGWWMGP